MYKYNLIALVLCLLCINQSLIGQSESFYSFQLEKEISLRAGGILVKPLKNLGKETSVDVNAYLNKSVETVCLPIANDGYGKVGNVNVWSQTPFFWQETSAEKAAVVISGSYQITPSSDVEVFQFYENYAANANPIPYFEVRPKNQITAEVIVRYDYADGTFATDTLTFSEVSERTKKRKLKSPEDLLSTCQKSLESDFRHLYSFAFNETAKFSLEKVKVSDKALKEELKNAGDLLENKRITELGNLYKRIYESDPSKEAAFCLGVCYELVGNYPMATKYYKKMPEFHTIARLKKSLVLFDYLQYIGADLELVDF